MSNEYIIKEIKKLKFNKRDIFILVSWQDMVYEKKPVIDEKFGKVVYDNEQNWRHRRHWTVKWKDSWIKITDLTSTSRLWADFYKTKVIPIIRQKTCQNNDIVISRN